MKTLSTVIFALFSGLGLVTSSSMADTLQIPIASQGGELRNISLPVTGEKQQSVRARYGDPDSSSGPTGDPPITRWNYTDFSVYFERDSVIHSVLKHRPQQSAPESSSADQPN